MAAGLAQAYSLLGHSAVVQRHAHGIKVAQNDCIDIARDSRTADALGQRGKVRQRGLCHAGVLGVVLIDGPVDGRLIYSRHCLFLLYAVRALVT